MSKILISITLTFFITSCSSGKGVTVKALSKTSTSWDGVAISYPEEGTEEITSTYLTISPKAELSFHCHPFPLLAYIVSGQLEVEKMNGDKKLFSAGDTLIEVVNTWHRAYNPSSIKAVKYVAFFIGQKSVDNRISYNAKNKNRCRS